MGFLTILTFAIFLVYFILIFSFFVGWIGAKNFLPTVPEEFPFVSVVVAVRNEENVLHNLLSGLFLQDYPPGSFEIIIVDDHSEDQSYQITESFRLQKDQRIKIMRLKDEKTGKKQALHAGIQEARGELIMITDADCWIPKGWITTFISFYLQKNKPKMILGLVDLKITKDLFGFLQNLEFLSLIGSGSGAASIGRPIFCNGANLMIEREAYFELTNPLNEKVISGDDTFLMHNLKKRYPAQIKFLKSLSALVFTNATGSFSEFINQRRRWASKSTHYADFDIILTEMVVSFTNIILFIWMIYTLFSPSQIFLYLFIIKLIIDWLLIAPVLAYFGKNKLHFLVPVLSVIYPVYYSWVVLITTFSKGFKWKGRRYDVKNSG